MGVGGSRPVSTEPIVKYLLPFHGFDKFGNTRRVMGWLASRMLGAALLLALIGRTRAHATTTSAEVLQPTGTAGDARSADPRNDLALLSVILWVAYAAEQLLLLQKAPLRTGM